MIDLKVTSLGGPEIGSRLKYAASGVRDAIREELADIGEEIVTRAQSTAPKATGIMASKIIWFFGKRGKRGRKGQPKVTRITDVNYKDGRIYFSAMPTGRVAHLVERGVNASFYQRPGRGKNMVTPLGPGAGRQGPRQEFQGPSFRYARTLRIAPRPFFMPAVESVGGAAGVNARLQGAIDRFAHEVGL